MAGQGLISQAHEVYCGLAIKRPDTTGKYRRWSGATPNSMLTSNFRVRGRLRGFGAEGFCPPNGLCPALLSPRESLSLVLDDFTLLTHRTLPLKWLLSLFGHSGPSAASSFALPNSRHSHRSHTRNYEARLCSRETLNPWPYTQFALGHASG